MAISRKKYINFTEDKYKEILNKFNFLVYQHNIELPMLRRILKEKNSFLHEGLPYDFDSFFNARDDNTLIELLQAKISLDKFLRCAENLSPKCICEDRTGAANYNCLPCGIHAIEHLLLAIKKCTEENKKEFYYMLDRIDSNLSKEFDK